MFICSVSTVVFNGNPLLRFDGYYILMDLAEIPNLRQKSTEVVKRFMVDLCLGLEQPESPFLPQRNRFLFGLYTVAAVVYRWIVVFSILFFLNSVFEPYGLKIIGQTIAFAGLVGLVVQPVWQLGKFFYTPGRMHKVKKVRLYSTVAVVGAIVAFVLFVPLPHRVKCAVEIRPRDAQWVYVDVPGQIQSLGVKPGDKVEKDIILASLSNLELQRDVEDFRGQVREAESELHGLQTQRSSDDRARQSIQTARQHLENLKEILVQKENKFGMLEVKAARSGTIIPPPVKEASKTPDGRLPAWSGSPFDPKNAGVEFAESDLLCLVGDPGQMEAVLIIDQQDIDLVDVGHAVYIKLDAYPTRTFISKIEQKANEALEVAPASLSVQAGGELDTRADSNGVQRPLSPSFEVRTGTLPQDDVVLQMGFRGRGKVWTKWQPLGDRIYRYLAHTFHFDL